MTRRETRDLQRALNDFTSRSKLGVGKLIVDGDKGHATNARVRLVAWWLGFGPKNRSSTVTKEFLWQLRHPHSLGGESTKVRNERAERGKKRRDERREHMRKNAAAAKKTTGVGTYDGHHVANWIIPYLAWAREHGWLGRVNSGWRDPLYSEHLCYQMCGAPSCPGRCAGRSSNHAGSTKPAGAVDVSDYTRFGDLMRRCPYQPPLRNLLGTRDPVHFSASGR